MRDKRKAYGKDDVFKLPDNGSDGKGGRKQKWHTFEQGMQLMVCGDSRNWYSPWEVPQAMRKDPAKREVRREPLGSASKVSYGNALSAHLKIQNDIAAEKYPEAKKKGVGRRKGETFESYGTRTVKGWADTRKNKKDAKGMKNIIPRYCEKINPIAIADLATTDVVEVLRPIWHSKMGMAEEVRALISRICRAAGHEELRAKTDPANIQAIRAVLGPQKKKKGFIKGAMPALDALEMPDFMAELRERDDEQTPRAVEITILTNMRTSTMRGMARDQLLLTETEVAKVKSLYHSGPRWIIPNALMKVDDDNHDFVLPLVPRAVEIIQRQIAYLEERYEGSRKVDLIWPGDIIPEEPYEVYEGRFSIDQPISENTMRDWVVDTMSRKATPHGFRASFQTWAENELQDDDETMKFNPDAIRYCMAHNPGDKVKRAYRRSKLWKPRLGVMTAWTRFLGPVKSKLKAVA
jgi:hypothetical protein